MEIKTKTENRSIMAKAIAKELGVESQYQGPPSFAYQVGELLVTREGSIQSDNEALLEQIRPFLLEKGWLEEDIELFLVNLPTAGMDGIHLTNLVNMVHSKQYLLNRVLRGEYFSISADFVQELKAKAPQSASDFLAIYQEFPEGDCKGLTFTEDRVAFAFAMQEDPDRVKALMELATAIVAACKQAKRVGSAETISDNEKFYLRAWLVRIGLGEKEHKQSRHLLLEGLKGHTAFKTPEQQERHRIKYGTKPVDVGEP